jgi:hypothetical protein
MRIALPQNAHSSEADIQPSVRLQLKMRDDISAVSDMLNQIDWMRKQVGDDHKMVQAKADC